MIVHHAARLHESVTNRRSHETKTAPLQIGAQAIGKERFRRDIFVFCGIIDDWNAVDEAPEIRIQRSALMLQRCRSSRIVDRGRDLGAIAYNTRVR